MEHPPRAHPIFSACGLNCGLCPNYYTAGASRCTGCGAEGFFNPSCEVLSCARRHGVEFCHLCGEFPCPRYDHADEADSFISHLHQLRDLERARTGGIEATLATLEEKMALLRHLLETCNDGRRKGLFCLAANLLEPDDLRAAVSQLEGTPEEPVKIRAATLLQQAAESRGIVLKLRKKPKA